MARERFIPTIAGIKIDEWAISQINEELQQDDTFGLKVELSRNCTIFVRSDKSPTPALPPGCKFERGPMTNGTNLDLVGMRMGKTGPIIVALDHKAVYELPWKDAIKNVTDFEWRFSVMVTEMKRRYDDHSRVEEPEEKVDLDALMPAGWGDF